MKIIRPSYEIVAPNNDVKVWMKDMLLHIEKMTRISHRSEDKIADGTAQKLLEFIVMGKGDFSVIEHSMLTVVFVLDRGITHEAVRHRLFAVTQESTRFVNYDKKMLPSFIYPQVDVECEHCLKGNESKRINVHDSFWMHKDELDSCFKCDYDETWLSAIMHSENCYKSLIKKGWRPQEARSVFPNALSSKIAMTANLKQWRHTLLMRTSSETHPQFRQVTIPLLRELQADESLGWLFADINPDSKQSEAMKRLR